MTPTNGRFRFPKVKERYIQWADLPLDLRRTAADSLEYNKTTWDNLGTAPIEKRSWEELTEHQKADAMSLGFYQRTWDCFQNHYRGYEWDELERDISDALQILGWSKTSWEDDDVPLSYDNEWSRLSETEQSVAAVLCFFEENWDRDNLKIVAKEIAEKDVIFGGGSVDGGSVGDGFVADGSAGEALAGGESSNSGSSTQSDGKPGTSGQDPDGNALSGTTDPIRAANSAGSVRIPMIMASAFAFVLGASTILL